MSLKIYDILLLMYIYVFCLIYFYFMKILDDVKKNFIYVNDIKIYMVNIIRRRWIGI